MPFSLSHLTNPDFMMTRRCFANQIFMASLSLLSLSSTSQPPVTPNITPACSRGFPRLCSTATPLHLKVKGFHVYGANLSPVGSGRYGINSLLFREPHTGLLCSPVRISLIYTYAVSHATSGGIKAKITSFPPAPTELGNFLTFTLQFSNSLFSCF